MSDVSELNKACAEQLRVLAAAIEKVPFRAKADIRFHDVTDLEFAKSFLPGMEFEFTTGSRADWETCYVGSRCEITLFTPTKDQGAA